MGLKKAVGFTYWIIRSWAVSGRSSNPFEAADLRNAMCMAAERKFAVIFDRLLVALRREMERKRAIGR
jgi:hypothetical protein